MIFCCGFWLGNNSIGEPNQGGENQSQWFWHFDEKKSIESQIVDIVHILENFTKFYEKKPEILDHFTLLLSLDMQNRPEN